MKKLDMHLLNSVGLLIVILLTASTADAKEMRFPPGWRTPTSEELNDSWRLRDTNKFALVNTDLNGDGEIDKTMLLLSEHGNGFGLFVLLSAKDRKTEIHRLTVIKDPSNFEVMGITDVKPGKYVTVCGKGYRKCKRGEMAELVIVNHAIAFFKEESASSYFYWDKRANTFRRAWIED